VATDVDTADAADDIVEQGAWPRLTEVLLIASAMGSARAPWRDDPRDACPPPPNTQG
jgi:hypothetical protein